jgi:hypothetical protein
MHGERLRYGRQFEHGRHDILTAAGPRTPAAGCRAGADRPAPGR